MRPCSGEVSHGYVASQIHEMGVRNQGEDDTNQIRKVVPLISKSAIRNVNSSVRLHLRFLFLMIGC
jgi:hypothetical protein